MTKLAILCLYRRIFSIYLGRSFDVKVIGLMAILVLFYFATTITKIFECIPRSRVWDSSIPGHCIDIPTLLNVVGIINMITDLIIVVLPFRVVWNLNMKLRKKLYVVLAFAFGMW